MAHAPAATAGSTDTATHARTRRAAVCYGCRQPNFDASESKEEAHVRNRTSASATAPGGGRPVAAPRR